MCFARFACESIEMTGILDTGGTSLNAGVEPKRVKYFRSGKRFTASLSDFVVKVVGSPVMGCDRARDAVSHIRFTHGLTTLTAVSFIFLPERKLLFTSTTSL